MQISGAAWGKGVTEQDRPAYQGLVRTGEEKMDAVTGLMVTQYKAATADLSLDELQLLRDILGRGASMFVPKQDLAKLDQELGNRRDPVWIAERERKAEERRVNQAETEVRLLAAGRAKLNGGSNAWEDCQGQIKAWWTKMKAAEKDEEWTNVFSANRMSARQIGSTKTMGGTFTVRNKFARTDSSRDRQISLDRGASGILERMVPTNLFDPQTGAYGKNDRGLHDLSASLLDGTKSPQSVLNQLKPYKDSIVVFMPVPTEDDLQIFDAINQLTPPQKGSAAETKQAVEQMRRELATMRSEMTRVKYAQGSDMHTTLFDVSAAATDPAIIRYGVTGRAQRKGEEEMMADETDLAARRTNALEHHVILKDGAVQKVNEIVMAYRSHDSPLFPLFARWDGSNKRFDVIDAHQGWAATGAYITDAGVWHS